MQEKEKKSYLFTKILLVVVVIFIALTLYAYKMIKDEKENSHRNSVVVNSTPMPHPPLSQRNEKEDTPANHEVVNIELNSSLENNKTKNIPEGAEYISDEELLAREANLSTLENEELLDEQIIPQDEIHKYEEAVTIPITEHETVPQTPISNNPFNNLSLGTPINTQNTEQHPTLGTPIGDTEVSPF